MDRNDAVSVIEKLIETCRDGQKGYADAAEHAKRPDLKSFFEQQSAERGHYAEELQHELSSLGGSDKKPSGSVVGVLHRTWIEAKATLGGGDKTILESVEQGEDSAKEAYEEALRSQLPSNLQTIVQRQAQSVNSAHDKVRSMRDSLAA